MMDPSELERVLAALDAYGRRNGAGVHADAARLLRAMAADFERLAVHAENCWSRQYSPLGEHECTCGLDAARAKWRLKP